MWQSSNNEDWEQRKAYLIRSLFQDIPAPVLSPVPEDQESRYGAGSPSDIPAYRPHSPLPPLIIERMPNRHDHPKEFYNDLEKKMKKLYKKLFLNKESSSDSVEDLIENYGVDLAASSSTNELQNNFGHIGGGNESVSTLLSEENRSQCHSSSLQASLIQRNTDRNINKSLSVDSSDVVRSNSPEESRDIPSSTQSLSQTQVTTVVEIHQEPSPRNIHLSPVLECQRICFDNPLVHIEMCQEKGYVENANDSIDETGGTENSGSAKEGVSKEDDLEMSSSDLMSHQSIEIMRKQKETYPSLGSLQNDPFASPSSKCSSIRTNFELHKNISLDLSDKNVSSGSQHNNTDNLLVHVEMCQEEGYVEKADDSIDEAGGTENSGSAKEGDSKEDDLEIRSSDLMSHQSIEIMRKQKESYPSLGSLQNDPFASPSSKCSSIHTNFELHKKISLDLSDKNVSSGSQHNNTDNPLVHVEMCQEEGYVEKADDSIDETGGTETSGSAKEGDSKEDDLEMCSSDLMSHQSIEIMRKQKESYPSLGSLQNDPFASPSSKCSSIRTNFELHKKISLDLSDKNVSSGSQHNNTDNPLVHVEMCQEEGYVEKADDSIDETGGTETSGSAKEGDSKEDDLEIRSSDLMSHQSIEIMRKQKESYPSLGSLQNDPFASPSSKCSSIHTNFELHKKISLDLSDKNVSSGSQHNNTDNPLVHVEMCQEEGYVEKADDSIDETGGTETSGSAKEGDSKEDDLEMCSSDLMSHQSIEIMRKQKESYPSLGSLQNDPFASPSSKCSSIRTNFELHKKISLDLSDKNVSSGSQHNNTDNPLVHVEMCQEGYVEKADDSIDETGGTETSGSAKEGDSKEDDLEIISSDLMSHQSIEIMRKQKESYPSLGSLQNDPFALPSSMCSSIRTNFELHKKISLDLSDKNVSSGSQHNNTDTSFSIVSVDFSNVLTTSTPKLYERSKLRSSSKPSETGKRVISQFSDEYEEDNSIIMRKRRKCENIATQTSPISESDSDDVFEWNQMKTNFFVGIPRIYKLCPCNDHTCGNIQRKID